MSSLFNLQALENRATLARPPYARSQRTPGFLLRQYRIILGILLASYRNDWVIHIFAGIVLPVGLIVFVKAVGATMVHEQAIFLLGGNMTMSIAFAPTAFLISKLSSARESHEFYYWIVLPIPKLILVLAIVSVALLFAIPGIIGTYLLGTLFLGLTFSGGWLLLLLVPLSVLPLAGLGAFIGSLVGKAQVANVITNFMIVFISFLSPMMIPTQVLPLPLRVISWFIPTTYIADAFRDALAGQIGSGLAIDVGLLILFSVACLTLANWKLEWRST